MTGSKPLLVILGPTAVGKTGVAIALARRFNGEIVSADSRQVYRYMDIGTAKPTPEQQRQAVHHLIDIVDPDENLTLARYQQLAYEAIDSIHSQGRLPLLVGGTGQYITAVCEGWSIPAVEPNERLRAELEAFAAAQGAETLHQRLQQVDPAAAALIDYHNVRRVVRALEVYLETGQPFSEQRRQEAPPYTIRYLGLRMERERLYAQADVRVDQMIAQGFLEEVHGLLQRGYTRTLPSMSGLGYSQLAAHLLDCVPLGDAIAATKKATRDFIRRQYTWFRGHDRGIVWHDAAALDLDTLSEECARWLEEFA